MHLFLSPAWSVGSMLFVFHICVCSVLVWRQTYLAALDHWFPPQTSELCCGQTLGRTPILHGLCLCAQADAASLDLPTGGQTTLACEERLGNGCKVLLSPYGGVQSQADLDLNPTSTVNYLIKPHWALVSPSVKWKFSHSIIMIAKWINAYKVLST